MPRVSSRHPFPECPLGIHEGPLPFRAVATRSPMPRWILSLKHIDSLFLWYQREASCLSRKSQPWSPHKACLPLVGRTRPCPCRARARRHGPRACQLSSGRFEVHQLGFDWCKCAKALGGGRHEGSSGKPWRAPRSQWTPAEAVPASPSGPSPCASRLAPLGAPLGVKPQVYPELGPGAASAACPGT